jgi:hypothetical protein
MSNETTPERPGDAFATVTVSPTLDLSEVRGEALNGRQKMTSKLSKPRLVTRQLSL